MVMPKLKREIFMDKSLIAWTHRQLNESKRKSNYRKKIFSEVGKSLLPIVLIQDPFPNPDKNQSTFLLKVEEFVRICKSQPSINSIGNPITFDLEPENFSIIRSALHCNP